MILTLTFKFKTAHSHHNMTIITAVSLKEYFYILFGKKIIVVAIFQTATIEYSPVCMCLCVCVPVNTITQKIMSQLT